jgi:hypothetical protein
MPVFIVCSLTLSMLVQSESPLLIFLQSTVALVLGLAATIVSLLGAIAKKLPNAVWFDLFATGTLVTWFAYWRKIFNADAPMFYFFPLYYTLLASAMALLFINRVERFDNESITQLRFLDQHLRLDAPAIVVFVLVSLAITRHYMLYPIAMTLFIVRYMLTRCLEIAGK